MKPIYLLSIVLLSFVLACYTVSNASTNLRRKHCTSQHCHKKGHHHRFHKRTLSLAQKLGVTRAQYKEYFKKPWWNYLNPVSLVAEVTQDVPVLNHITRGADAIVGSVIDVATFQKNPIQATNDIVATAVKTVVNTATTIVAPAKYIGVNIDDQINRSGAIVSNLASNLLGQQTTAETARAVATDLSTILTSILPVGAARTKAQTAMQAFMEPALKAGIPVAKVVAAMHGVGAEQIIGQAVGSAATALGLDAQTMKDIYEGAKYVSSKIDLIQKEAQKNLDKVKKTMRRRHHH